MARPAADALPIRIYGDPCLRRMCREVAPDEDVTDLAAAMVAALDAADGVGLAAPQVGDGRRVILCRDPGRPDTQPTVLVNPEVVQRSGPLVSIEEGCLSFPGLYVHIHRPRDIKVRYRDLAGRPRELADDGLIARVIQHEVDHLDGVLFIDRLPTWRRWLFGWRLHRIARQAGKAAA